MEEDRPATPQEEALSALQYRSEEVYQTTEAIYDTLAAGDTEFIPQLRKEVVLLKEAIQMFEDAFPL